MESKQHATKKRVDQQCEIKKKILKILWDKWQWKHCHTKSMLLLLLLSCLSRVRLCATPQTAAHQASPSLGFSRQEHWSGLPFPSPMDESEKWKWSCSVVSNSRTAAYQAPLSMGFSRQKYWSGVPLPSPLPICKFRAQHMCIPLNHWVFSYLLHSSGQLL